MPDKTREERINELLEGSAQDAVGAMKGPSLSDLAPAVQDSQTQDDEPADDVEDTTTGGKKVRIPASRLKTLTSKVEQLEAQLRDKSAYEDRVAALEAQIAHQGEEEIPEWWKEAYGDTDVSKAGYKHQQRVMREELQRSLAEQDAERQAQEAERDARISAIEQSFDTQMEELEDEIGRSLTASQKSELLDIVGEYSPMDGDRYLAYLPVSKAYELWQKGQGTDAGKQEMARIAGSQSQGGAQSAPAGRPQWGDWRGKYGL